MRHFLIAILVGVLVGCAPSADETFVPPTNPVMPTDEMTEAETVIPTVIGTDEAVIPTPTSVPVMYLPPTVYPYAPPEGASVVLGMGELHTSVSPNGRYFAVRSALGVMVYDFDTLAPMWDDDKPAGEITWLTEGRVQIGRFIWQIDGGALVWEASAARQISPDGTLVVGRNGTTVTLYDRESGATKFVFTPPTEEVFTETLSYYGYDWGAYVSFSPNSRYAAVYYLGFDTHERGAVPLVKIWDLQTGLLTQSLPDYFPYYENGERWAWSSDSTKFVTGAAYQTTIWDVQTGKMLWQQPYSPHIFWSPDGTRILFGNLETDMLQVWDAEKITLLYEMEWTSAYPQDWSPDSTRFSLTEFDANYRMPKVIIYDASTGKPIDQVEGVTCYPFSCALSPNQNYFLSSTDRDNAFAIWDLRQPDGSEPVFRLVGTNRIGDLAWSPDGTSLASGESDYDPHILMWNVASAETDSFIALSPNEGHSVNTLDWSSDNRWIAFSISDSNLDGYWSLDQENFVRLPMGYSVAISPDSNTVATIGDGGIDFLTAGTNELLVKTPIEGYYFRDIDWSSDSGYLAVALVPDDYSYSPEETISEVKIIEAATGNIIRHLSAPGYISSVAWSPDSTHIAGGYSQDTVVVWDAETGAVVAEISGGAPSDEYNILSYLALDWSPDGSLLAGAYGNNGTTGDCVGCAGAGPGAVVVWQADQNFRRVHYFFDEFYEASVVVFSPDGSRLAAGSRSGAIILWDMGQ